MKLGVGIAVNANYCTQLSPCAKRVEERRLSDPWAKPNNQQHQQYWGILVVKTGTPLPSTAKFFLKPFHFEKTERGRGTNLSGPAVVIRALAHPQYAITRHVDSAGCELGRVLKERVSVVETSNVPKHHGKAACFEYSFA